MRKTIASMLTIVALSISEAHGAPGYAIVERPLGEQEEVAASNQYGWLITRVRSLDSSNSISTLHGPNGYRRDISSFLAGVDYTGSNNGSIFPVAIGVDGTVYLAQNQWASYTDETTGETYDRVYIGDKLYRLPIDGSARIPHLQTEQIVNNYSINQRGEVVMSNTSENRTGAPFTIRRFNPSELKPISITFPKVRGVRNSIVRVELGESGRFVAYSTAQPRRPTRRKDGRVITNLFKLSGVCTGSFESEQIRCLAPKEIENLGNKRLSVDAINGRELILGSPRVDGTRYRKIDLATLKLTGSFAMPTSSEMLFASDGKVIALRDSFLSRGNRRLLVVDAANKRSNFSCKFGRRVRIVSPISGPSTLMEGESGSLLVMGERDASRYLYQIIPTDLAVPYPGAVGQCQSKESHKSPR